MKRYVRSESKRFAVREAWSGLEELRQDEEEWSPIGAAFSSPPETGTGLASGPSPRASTTATTTIATATTTTDPAGSRSVSRLATLLPSSAFARLADAGPEPSGHFGRALRGEPWPAIADAPLAPPSPAREVVDLAAQLSSAAFERPITPQGPDPLRARFGALFEDALPPRSGLSAVAWCARAWIGRRHACGAESTAIEGWCGSPLCASCAGGRAQGAAATARATWDERVVVARVTTGAGGDDLPDGDAVTAARAAWSRAAGPAGVETLARTILTPGGLAIYARILPGHDEARAVAGLIEGARGAGLDAAARIASRAEAADDLAQALEAEARAFSRGVAHDLGRIDGGADAATITRGWVDRVQARHHDGRRQIALGGKGALAAETKLQVGIRPATCPAHGEGCAAAAILIRDGDGEPRALAPDALGTSPTRQSIARLF